MTTINSHSNYPRIHNFSKKAFVVAVIAPAIIFFLVWFYWPIVSTLWMSFTNANTYNPRAATFVGLENYIKLVSRPTTWLIIGNTITFAVLTVVGQLLMGLAIALMLESITKGRAFFRTIYFIPFVTDLAAVSLMWKWLYQPRFGLINVVLDALYLPTQTWLDDPKLALASIIVMSIWQGMGYSVVILLAGLGGIPREYQEAASIDGANAWKRLILIKLPLLRPALAFLAVAGMVNGMQVFTQINMMTQGRPFDTTRTIVYEIFEKGFRNSPPLGGYASALSIILLVAILGFSYLQIRMLSISWEY